MERKNITMKKHQAEWVENNDDFELSKEVRELVNKAMNAEQWEQNTIQHQSGVYIGRNSVTGEENKYNRFDSPFDSNVLIAGQIASGKTATSMIEFSQYLTSDTNQTPLIITIDNYGAMKKFTDKHNGITYNVGSSEFAINPFDLWQPETRWDKNEFYSQIRGLFNTVFDSLNIAFDIDEHQWDMLFTIIDTLYRDKNIDVTTLDTSVTNPPTIRDDLIPTLIELNTGQSDLYSELSYEYAFIKQTARTVLTKLRPLYQQSTLTGRMTGDTTIQLPEHADLLHFDCSEISTDLSPIQYLLYMKLYQWASSIDRNVIIHLDDPRQLLQNEYSHELLTTNHRNSRHNDISVQLTTVSLTELVEQPFADPLLGNTSHVLIHRLEEISDEAVNTLNLSPDHTEFIKNCTIGNAQKEYSEGVLSLPNMGNQPVQIYPHTEVMEEILSQTTS